MIEDVGVQAYPAFPSHGGGLGVDAHFFELAHVAPQLEGSDLEQVAEEYAPLQPVLEPQPQLVVAFRLARGYSHLFPFLVHVGLEAVSPSSARRRSDIR